MDIREGDGVPAVKTGIDSAKRCNDPLLAIPVDSAIYGVPFTNTFAYKPLLA